MHFHIIVTPTPGSSPAQSASIVMLHFKIFFNYCFLTFVYFIIHKFVFRHGIPHQSEKPCLSLVHLFKGWWQSLYSDWVKVFPNPGSWYPGLGSNSFGRNRSQKGFNQSDINELSITSLQMIWWWRESLECNMYRTDNFRDSWWMPKFGSEYKCWLSEQLNEFITT